MAFSGRWRGSPRVALATAVSVLFLVLFGLPAGSNQPGTPVASPEPAESAISLPPAWLEFGPEGRLIARVIVEGECPKLLTDAVDFEMTRRAPASAAFPVVACEATVPFGTLTASILSQELPLPAGPIRRIAVIGDTGCRVNDWEKKYQACNDPEAWPFAQVAESVANWDPDLIVHVGDYLYRESPCPADMVGCQGNPHGDNWATWNADFFTPAASFLGSAPWIFMRGNHETCDRNPAGWFTFLDPRRYQAACQRFTEPYTMTLPGLSLAVIDSAEAADEADSPEETAEYTREFKLLGQIAPSGSWLVTHRPVWGILEGKEGEFDVENATYAKSSGDSLQADYALVLSGHIHAAETIAFDATSDRRPQLVSGNAGTALDDIPTASPTAGELGDPTVAQAETFSAFGFMTIEPDGNAWIATQRDKTGNPLLECNFEATTLRCGAAAAD
jgi:Calcineurin-like phosphoesterase